jgi:putative ABC transport system ATP-binding protein
MDSIRIIGLSKLFNMGHITVDALVDINLEIQAQSFTVVMGPSGSGKSTLLYLLGGLDRPTSGSIVVQGQALESMDENQLAEYRKQKVGFIFQSFNLVPSMTALGNVAFPMRFARVPQHERHKRSLELLKQVGLSDRVNHRPTELSGGQQQRVAIARALVNDPFLILADEPTGNLDTSSGNSVMHLLSDLHNIGHTVLVVSHDLRMLRFATDRVYLLDGRIVTEDAYQVESSLEHDLKSIQEKVNLHS